jgi:hypothetical protein
MVFYKISPQNLDLHLITVKKKQKNCGKSNDFLPFCEILIVIKYLINHGIWNKVIMH